MCSHRFSVPPQRVGSCVNKWVGCECEVGTAERIILFTREIEGAKEDGELIKSLHLCGGQHQGHPDASPLK